MGSFASMDNFNLVLMQRPKSVQWVTLQIVVEWRMHLLVQISYHTSILSDYLGHRLVSFLRTTCNEFKKYENHMLADQDIEWLFYVHHPTKSFLKFDHSLMQMSNKFKPTKRKDNSSIFIYHHVVQSSLSSQPINIINIQWQINNKIDNSSHWYSSNT